MDGEKGRLFEETAFPCLNALYGFGLLLTGRPDEAEDLVQETFLRAFRFFNIPSLAVSPSDRARSMLERTAPAFIEVVTRGSVVGSRCR